jgi:hypothetical protein
MMGFGGGGEESGLSEQDLLFALMSQGQLQQNQGYQQSPDLQTRAFGMAQSGAMPFMNALAQAPLIRDQQRQKKSGERLKMLKTISGIQADQATIAKTEAETAEIPNKGARAERRLKLDEEMDKAQLILEKAGFAKDQIKSTLEAFRAEVKNANERFQNQQLLLRAQQEAAKDPALAQLVSLAKLTKDDALVDAITSHLEAKWGIRLKDNRGWWESIMPEFLGGKQSPIGQPMPGRGQQAPPQSGSPQLGQPTGTTAMTATSPVNPEASAAEDEVMRMLGGE